MRRKFFLAIIACLVIFLSSPGSISATLNVSLSDQGTDAKTKSTGAVIISGNLEVSIYDAPTGGNLVYNETFTGVINNGTWNVMLGENESNPLSLEFGKIYYKDYKINGQDLDFTNLTGGSVERQFFYSPLGDISGEDVSTLANLTIANLSVTNNISASSGLFSWLGSLASRITSLFVQDIDFIGNINGSGNITTTGRATFGSLNVTGTSYLGNIIISADNITTNNIISKTGNISFFNSTNSEIVRFLDNGRVGIGTSSPSQKLEVEGNTNITQNLTVLGDGRIEDKTGFVMPVGVIQFYGGSTTPKGWLFCNGTAVSRTTYADLFVVIGTTFGAGDGSTTFNLPNLTGRYPVGLSGSGTLGASVGTALTNQENRAVGQHTHTFTGTSSQSTSAGSSHSHGATGLTFTGSALGTHGHTFTGNALDAHGHSQTITDAGWPMSTDQGYGHDWSGWSTGANWMTQPTIVAASAGTPSGTISSNSAGTPSGSIGGSTASESSHTHTITPSGTNANAGSTAGTNAPYIQLNCIIKY